jgi:hypothetical protein
MRRKCRFDDGASPSGVSAGWKNWRSIVRNARFAPIHLPNSRLFKGSKCPYGDGA